MDPAKIVLLVIWLLLGASFAVAPAEASTLATVATWARYGFWLMLAAHLLEFALFSSRLKQAPGSMATHFLNTLVFGVLHIRDLPEVGEESSA